MRVGIIGAGGMGREHAANLAAIPGVEIGGVADARHDAAQHLAASTGADVFADGLDLIQHGRVEAVIVASPDSTHAAYVLACVERGLPVLCEKPLAHTLDDARAVLAADRAGGRRLVQVGFMRPFDPPHVALKDALARLGAIHHVRLVHRNAGSPHRGAEDIIVQSLVHEFHSVRWLTGGEVASVTAQAVGPPGSVRFVRVAMELQSGALATAEFEDGAYGYEVGVEVNAAAGTVSIDAPESPLLRSGGEIRRHIGDDWFGRFRDAYRREVEAWIAAIRSGVMVDGPDAADGVAAQAIAAAALRSLTEGPGQVPVA